MLPIGLVIIGIVILMLLRVPVGFAFGAGALALMAVYNVDPNWAMPSAFALILSFTFLALPLYMFLGTCAGDAGIAEKISKFFVTTLGRIRGGLGGAVVLTNGVFGAISGVALSALVGIGKAFVPELEKEGYPRSYTAALLCVAAVLALMIPPSGTMIIYGFMGRLPITLCFLAPLLPGLILIGFLMVVHLVLCRRISTIHIPSKTSFRTQIRETGRTTLVAFPGLLMPIIVLGGIYGGFVTPSEAAAVGAFYAIFVGLFVYRSYTFKQLGKGMLTTGISIGTIVCLFFFFIMVGKVMILENVSEQISSFLLSISHNPWISMILINILLLLMGMFMDDASAMLITAIMLLPVVVDIGFDPYHFAAIACLNLGMGLITPPVAPLLYVAGSVAEVRLETYAKPVLYFLVFAYLPTLAITIAFPQLSTFLPYLVSESL